MTSKMRIEDRFECSAKTLFEVVLDSTYDDAVMRAIGMKKELIEERDTPEGKVELFRMTPSTELPGFVKKIVGGSSSYIETIEWSYDKMMNEWSEQLGFAQKKVDIRGSFLIKPISDNACTRTIEGTFDVRVPLVGKKIEEYVIENTKESFKKSTAFTKQWLKDHGLEGR